LKKSFLLIKEQKATIQKLVQRGVRSKYDLLNIEKEYTDVSAELEASLLSIRRSELAISEANNRISEKLNSFRAQASDELQKTASLINKFEAKLVGEEDKVAKTAILSPVDGIVKQLNFNTIGGVVKSGMDLIEIVPQSDILLVEAKIDPKDIAFINPSQKAIVKITAYDFSIYGGLVGKIVEISADSIVDENSKEDKSYYRVIVKTDKNYLERNGKKLPIIPGMIASVDIVTGKKTILDFILKPILKVKQDSLHER
jgi:adhesin transport system membrane fusion protein